MWRRTCHAWKLMCRFKRSVKKGVAVSWMFWVNQPANQTRIPAKNSWDPSTWQTKTAAGNTRHVPTSASPSPLQFLKLVLRCWKEVFPPTTWKLQKERVFIMVMESWSHWGWIYKWCLNGSSPGSTFCNLTQAFCLLLQWSRNPKQHNESQNPSHMWKIRARYNQSHTQRTSFTQRSLYGVKFQLLRRLSKFETEALKKVTNTPLIASFGRGASRHQGPGDLVMPDLSREHRSHERTPKKCRHRRFIVKKRHLEKQVPNQVDTILPTRYLPLECPQEIMDPAFGHSSDIFELYTKTSYMYTSRSRASWGRMFQKKKIMSLRKECAQATAWLLRDVMSCHVMSCHANHVMWCDVMWCNVM